jgi:hypothetical protein
MNNPEKTATLCTQKTGRRLNKAKHTTQKTKKMNKKQSKEKHRHLPDLTVYINNTTGVL